MACKYSQHFFSAFGNHWRLVNVKNGCNRLTRLRGLSSTSCLSKSSPHNSSDNDVDLDFFGVESIENSKADNKQISSAESRWLNSLVKNHVEPKKKEIQVRTRFGYVYSGNDHGKKQHRREPDHSNHSPSSGDSVNHDPLESRLTVELSDDDLGGKPSTFSPQQTRKHFQIDHHIGRNKAINSERKMPNATNEMSEIDNQYFPYVTEDGHKVKGSGTNKSSSEKNMSFIDEQYFEYDNQNKQNVKLDSIEKNNSTKFDVRNDMSFMDEQYISHNYKSDMKGLTSMSDFAKQSEELNDKSSFFDEQYFNQHVNSSSKLNEMKETGGTTYINSQYVENLEIEQGSKRGKHQQSITNESKHHSSVSKTSDYDSVGSEFNEASDSRATFRITRKSNLDMSHETERSSENAKPESAFDLAMKLRKQYAVKSGVNLVGKFDPKEYDSKGLRILKNQVPHLQNAPSTDVIHVLRKSIIYDKNDIVAISKPYNLPSHGGPGVVHSVESLGDKIIPHETLLPVHRLGKETTGVMLLAKNEDMAYRLSSFIESGRAKRRYLTITKNIPELQTGEIDIPIIEGKAGDRTRMCLKPHNSAELSPVYKTRVRGENAITRYRVLDAGPKCALLECVPLTGRKHQIRVHLAFGLNCPILGDHKYAHTNTIAPMKLHPEMLKRLRIQQSKVRYLAMHLHYRSIVFPEFFNGRNLYISAPLPPHFLRNLQDLKMKIPKNT
ncbi:Mitochondrial RNA pseudouridine synthase rpusd4 [Mactra antiquata]